jgi:hypothetical protein
VTPVYRIRQCHGRQERERLPPRSSRSEIDGIPGTILEPRELRTELVTEAVRRGLTRREAEVFVAAWGPELGLDEGPREGPQAAGTAPLGLGAAKDAIVYFAPPALVEALLPMEVDPAPRAFARVFLVRVVDPRRATTEELTLPVIGPGPLSHPPDGRVRPDVAHLTLPVRVRGPLSSAGVERVIQRHINELNFCYQRALETSPRLRGTLTVTASIAATGAVSDARISAGRIGDEAMRSCVSNAVRRWSFPAAEPAQPSEIEARLDFAENRSSRAR